MKNKTTKKEQGRYCYLPALNFLSDNSDFEKTKNPYNLTVILGLT